MQYTSVVCHSHWKVLMAQFIGCFEIMSCDTTFFWFNILLFVNKKHGC